MNYLESKDMWSNIILKTEQHNTYTVCVFMCMCISAFLCLAAFCLPLKCILKHIINITSLDATSPQNRLWLKYVLTVSLIVYASVCALTG